MTEVVQSPLILSLWTESHEQASGLVIDGDRDAGYIKCDVGRQRVERSSGGCRDIEAQSNCGWAGEESRARFQRWCLGPRRLDQHDSTFSARSSILVVSIVLDESL